jgi:hypothetical protein
MALQGFYRAEGGVMDDRRCGRGAVACGAALLFATQAAGAQDTTALE